MMGPVYIGPEVNNYIFLYVHIYVFLYVQDSTI